MKNKSKTMKPVEDQIALEKQNNVGQGAELKPGSILKSKTNVKQPDDQVKVEKTSEKEVNGPKGLEPTRYGDWESKGRCYDF